MGADTEKYFEEMEGGDRVRCTLNGHVMRNTKEDIEKFVRCDAIHHARRRPPQLHIHAPYHYREAVATYRTVVPGDDWSTPSHRGSSHPILLYYFPPILLLSVNSGKKFRKLAAKDREMEELRAYEPMIAPSVNFEGSLFCSLTGVVFNRTLNNAQKHIKGERYLRALARYEKAGAGNYELFREPSRLEVEEQMQAVQLGDVDTHPDGTPINESRNEADGAPTNETTECTGGDAIQDPENAGEEDFEFGFLHELATDPGAANGHSDDPNKKRMHKKKKKKKKNTSTATEAKEDCNEQPQGPGRKPPKILKKDTQQRKRSRAGENV